MSKKMIVASLTMIVLLNIIGLFFWQLYNENQSLKAVQKANARPVNTFKPQIKAATVAIQSIKAEPLEKKSKNPTDSDFIVFFKNLSEKK